MSDIADLVQVLQALQLDRFTGLPGEIRSRLQRTEESPVRIAVVGPQSNLVLNCLVRDILFHETSLPTHLRWPADAADLGVVFGRHSEPLDDAREWKPLQRATYLKKLRSKIDSWAAEKDSGKGERVVITYPFTNQFKPTAVELQNFREGADVVLDTWITRRATDGAEQLAISGSLGKFEGLQPRVALASAVAGMSSPELKFFDTMVARIVAPAVKRATAARATLLPSTQSEATTAIQALRTTAETAQNLAAAIERALGQTDQPTQLKRVPSSSASYSPPTKKVIQMQLTDKAPQHIVAAHSQVLPGTETVPPYTVESKAATPYVANDEPEPGWNPSQATWQPRDPEWKPKEQPWQPKAADWKPKSDEITPEWQPKAPDWTPKQEAWKPKIPPAVKEQEWQPKSETWRPSEPSWKPQPPEWQEATEA